jgi:tRNA (guanine37-N1)-methyltransferase
MKQLKFIIITSLPDAFPGILNHGIIGKALKNNLWSLEIVNLYNFGIGNHKKIDDSPYGGGSGMIILPEVLEGAIEFVKKHHEDVIFYYMSPRGITFDQNMSKKLSESEYNICIICGRFEGIDQRVLDFYQIQEISIGNYVISNGELGAMIIIDSITRLLPEVMGNNNSKNDESFNFNDDLGECVLEYNQYTRPSIWNNIPVPDVLLNGNHKKIKEWRNENSLKITQEKQKNILKNK